MARRQSQCPVPVTVQSTGEVDALNLHAGLVEPGRCPARVRDDGRLELHVGRRVKVGLVRRADDGQVGLVGGAGGEVDAELVGHVVLVADDDLELLLVVGDEEVEEELPLVVGDALRDEDVVWELEQNICVAIKRTHTLAKKALS